MSIQLNAQTHPSLAILNKNIRFQMEVLALETKTLILTKSLLFQWDLENTQVSLMSAYYTAIAEMLQKLH